MSLSLDPDAERFSGRAEIDVTIARPTRELWMHGRDLEIASAKLVRAGQTLAAAVENAEPGLLGFRFDRELEPGEATLRIEYSGVVVSRDGAGIFVESEGGSRYIYTQFEPLDARRAFPCFDEPRFKVPWTLAIETGADLVAVSNTPVTSEEPIGDGKKRVSFATTRPLPTYLVAFAVGRFDFVDAGKSSTGVPMRIVVPKGRGAEAAYAARVTPEILAELERYFGRPYPYRKLDTLVIPTTQGFGAMEHPGLITFASRLILWTPEQDSFVRRRRFALIQVHEIGHQWFGNVVTMPWWDDIWLNEAFASWIENRVLASWRPAWKLEAFSMETRERAIASDVLASARKIREPITGESDIESAFDGITYSKGESVINMFETWLGREVWRDGIRAYVNKYEWKTATAADLLAQLSATSGRDVTTPFSSFLEQNGVPLVQMALRCEQGAAPVVTLSQRRYLPLGSRGDRDRRWQIPVCVTHPGGDACTLLVEATGELALGEEGAPCPAWVNPNKGGVGYYRALIDKKAREALAAAPLSLAERLSLAGDVGALLQAGLIEPAEALAHAGTLAKDSDPVLGLAGARLAALLDPLVTDKNRAAYQARLQAIFGPALERIGFDSRDGEPPQTGELRAELIELLGARAGERRVLARSLAMARDHLAGKRRIDPAISSAILSMAARAGDAALLDSMIAAARSTTNRIERRELLVALGHFRGELTERALRFAISGAIDARDGVYILEHAAFWPETRAAAVGFVVDQIAALEKSLSETQMAYLPEGFETICEPDHRARLEKLFKEHTARLPGGALALEQALERIDLCIAFRSARSAKL